MWITAKLALADLRDRAQRPLAGLDPTGAPAARAARLRARPAPDTRFAILFTPRSGSSRLTDILTVAGLSRADEGFNTAFLPEMARKLGARDLPDYVDILCKWRAEAGVFGCEVTPAHIARVFGTSTRFSELLRPTHLFVLLREDIVAQAVSITRQIQTGQHHATSLTDGDIAAAEAGLTDDGAGLRLRVAQLARMEARIDAALSRIKPPAHLLSYERLQRSSEEEIAAAFGEALGRPAHLPAGFASAHRKLSGSRASEIAERFRTRNTGFLTRIAKARATRLSLLKGSAFLAGTEEEDRRC
ncbi:Stf0 family sulfotransferase [Roseisalinus antarcticus]|uniref:Stf0 sulfotransferase n=1 Tax=Roseisalinus antarcticus TaxID=254357 RepID=A0A1Y5S8W7_9RHOB|nr:Stf0 family sulfotransferase [Roseisalinus antarcticus]SLN33729.1 Stf0 sulfotransferase [Roseisalinus antarcticus]